MSQEKLQAGNLAITCSYSTSMIDNAFLRGFQQVAEAKWRVRAIDPTIYGFQFEQGRCWNLGLSDRGIADYERASAVRFPHDFKAVPARNERNSAAPKLDPTLLNKALNFRQTQT
jgi:hypothetical protein